jgi:hypothetical protein
VSSIPEQIGSSDQSVIGAAPIGRSSLFGAVEIHATKETNEN